MSPHWWSLATILPAVLFCPLLLGIINRTKARFAGRSGQPLLQPYYDLMRLLGKGAVYSSTTTRVFRAAPSVSLAALFLASMMLPVGGLSPALSFAGDLMLFGYLLALSRFAVIAAALDTGSSFEGMGASREAAFSAFAEPGFFIILGTLAWKHQSMRLGAILEGADISSWVGSNPALFLTVASLFLILLAENSRIPVDDPNTHLELTMIHEVMVLDHSGPDLAFILYGSALKMWIFSALLVSILLPPSGNLISSVVLFLAGMALCAILVGVIESAMARIRMNRVPQYLGLSAVLAGLAALLLIAGGSL